MKLLNYLPEYDMEKNIRKRLKEFQILGEKGEVEFDLRPYISYRISSNLRLELTYCILTAAERTEKALLAQHRLEGVDLTNFDEVQKILLYSGIRFPVNRATFITVAMKNFKIVEKALTMESMKARQYLSNFIPGFGFKEASHYLRNVGRKDVAILDTHILKMLGKEKYKNEKEYLEIENEMKGMADDLAYLDLKLFAESKGAVLK